MRLNIDKDKSKWYISFILDNAYTLCFEDDQVVKFLR